MRRITVAAAVAAGILVSMAGPAHATTYNLYEPENFQNPPGEQPALTEYPQNYWSADPSLIDSGDDRQQHMIYIQGGQTGTTPDPDYGENPELLWNDTKSGSGTRPEHEVTMGDITDLSWRTRKSGGVNDPDWFMDIYTKPDGDDDDIGWYGSNYEFIAGSGDTGPYSSNEWTTWGADSNGAYEDDDSQDILSTKVWRNYQHDNVGDGYSSRYSLQDMPADWKSEEIKWISLTTGSTVSDFAGDLDFAQFAYDTGSPSGDVTVNFSSTPEPATMGLLGLGLVGLVAVGYTRRRRS